MTTYAEIDVDNGNCQHFTKGKQYEVIEEIERCAFIVENDSGLKCICLWSECSHLSGGSWKKLELAK